MTQIQQNLPLPTDVAEKIASIGNRTLKVRIGTALVAAGAVLLAAMAVAMAIDYLATLYNSPWRRLLSYSAWVFAALSMAIGLIAAWRHTRRSDRVAASIDREVPELEERWSTVVEISGSTAPGQTHPSMYSKVAEEATRWSPKIEVDRVVPLNGLIRALMFLTTIAAILAIAVAIDTHRTAVLFQRFWSPSSTISATEISDLPNNLVVGRGESLEISALLAGSPVESATLLLDPQEGEQRTIQLTPRGVENLHVSHRLRSVKMPMKYRLRAGDGQSPWYEIEVADRPKLGKVQLKLTPPAYTRKKPKEIDRLPRRISALEGSLLEVAIKPKHAIKDLTLKLKSGKGMKQHVLQHVVVDDDGWYRWQTILRENFSLSPILTEEHGLTNRRPPVCEVRARADKPPVVRIISPNETLAVRPGDTIPIEFRATDDVGILYAELVVYDDNQDGTSQVLDTIAVPLNDQQGATEVKATIDLDLSKYEVVDGGQLSFAIRVHEDRGQAVPEVESPESPNVPQSHTGSPSAVANNPNAANNPGESELQAATSPTPADAGSQGVAAATPPANPAAQIESTSPAVSTSADTTVTSNSENSVANAATPANTQTLDGTPSPSSPNSGQSSKSSPNSSSESPSAEDAQQTAAQATASRENSLSPAEGDSRSTNDDNAGENTEEGRMATTERQTLNTSTNEGTNKNLANQADRAAAANSQSAASSPKPDKASQQAGSKSSKTGASSQQSKDPSSQAGSSQPPNPMDGRQLDVQPKAQSSSSSKMRLKIDEWAGSYDGQQRNILEIAIAPAMEQIDKHLEKAQRKSRGVLDALDADHLNAPATWQSKHDRDVGSAGQDTDSALQAIRQLKSITQGTPYAFIGLQLDDIGLAHVDPAHRSFWKALQLKGSQRVEATRDGWQHVERARELMVLLTERFETTRQEYKLAESVERIKKMYQVFVEDAMALLKPEGEGNKRYRRSRVEFELDEEYLARLKEVLEMRNQMRAELARILAEDPRLLSRFLDAARNRQKVIRNELDKIIEGQEELNRETKAWTLVEEKDRARLAVVLLGRHAESAQNLALGVAELADRFATWSPLVEEEEDADMRATTKLLSELAATTRELSADGARYARSTLQAKKNPTEGEAAADGVPEKASAPAETFDEMLVDVQKLYDRFSRLEILLRRIGTRDDLTVFATTRLLETQRLTEATSAWIRQAKQQQAGSYHRSAEVAQYRLAMQTDTLAGKLADLEQGLAGLLQTGDGQLPEAVAEQARGLMASLDEQAAPNQLAAVYALRRNEMVRGTARQVSALNALKLAGDQYDKMIELMIKELDKLPVQDPIASLLDDPTLDQLLANLEQEIPINEILGIPMRPSNLRIISDWLQPGGDNATRTGGKQAMLLKQMKQKQSERKRQLDRAYRRAVARALKEAEAEDLVEEPLRSAKDRSDWNRLLSELGDDLEQGSDKAPPERYRRAIEQYFRRVSGAEEEPTLSDE